jgi:hypothetical protein
MKNIHLIPTDKSSRLYLHSENELQLRTNIIRTSEDYLGSNQHIYITSDEEIKEGDYVYDSKDNVIRYVKKYLKDDWIKKIILTTDQDLIKDGVQAIDDEFLEWFVQNPSCEEVEIKTEYLGSKCLKCGFIENHDEVNTEYCPKCKNTTYEHLYNHNKIIIPKEEPKQETLEEAAARHFNKEDLVEGVNIQYVLQCAFIQGANWQAKRMYSEEEMIDFAFNTYCYISKIMNVPFNQISENKLHAIDNLEQFKKRNGK